MGGEDGRQTNHTVSIQHEHALPVNNIDQGILKDKGGRRGGEGKTNDITHVHNSLWRGNFGGQTRLHSCLVLAVNPINNIQIFGGTDPTV